jgi:hypothetical protein
VSATPQELVFDRPDIRPQSRGGRVPVFLFGILLVIRVLGIGVVWGISSISQEFRPFSVSA